MVTHTFTKMEFDLTHLANGSLKDRSFSSSVLNKALLLLVPRGNIIFQTNK